MKLLFLFVQGVIATGMAWVGLWLCGPQAFAFVSTLVFVMCWVTLAEAAQQRELITRESTTVRKKLGAAFSAFFFGLLWPAVPVIIVLQFVAERAGAEADDADR